MFKVPSGKTKTVKIEVMPPASAPGGKAWAMVDLATGAKIPENGLNVEFEKKSTKPQREKEYLTFEFSFAAGTGDSTWTFFGDGLVFDNTPPYKSKRLSAKVTRNGQLLKVKVVCPTDAWEDFKFVFLAKWVRNPSGVWQVVSSKDPGGSIGRGGG